ncbi:MAG: secondary thiamine-phosphate synthase enzyme YjbQ [Planctomycetota bacterium]|jgi:secondary thiamine-phosphate synthase enzyme
MAVHTDTIPVSTQGRTDMVDLTEKIAMKVAGSGLRNGIVTVFVTGSTGGITTVEFEPGLKKDMKIAYERIAPERDDYHHHATWGCDNGSSHVRASMLGPSLTVPFVEGKLQLGTWQQVVLLDFDTRPRKRNLVVQIMGE